LSLPRGCELGPDSLLYDSVLFRQIYNNVGKLFPEQLCWLDYFVAGFVIMFILVNGVLLGAALLVWGERRLMGRVQNRLGPNRWGPFGLLQPIADLVKLIAKEDLIPREADKLAFTLVPIVMVMPLLLGLAVVPFARNTFLADLNVGVLYVLAVTSVGSLGVFMAGWASGNRYALFGAMRGVAMLISYEIPAVLSLVGVVLIAGSMRLTDVVNAQSLPFILVQPLGIIVFMLGVSAELNRTPFDIVEAESELVAGFHTEYSGTKFALIQAAEFGGVLAASAVMATLFLGGWSGPFLSGQLGALWFLAKVVFFVLLFEWIRFTFPRLRVDQIMAFAWKFLFPLSLLNLFVTALEVYWLRDGSGALSRGDLGVMLAINMAVAVAAIGLSGNVIKERVRPPVRAVGVMGATPRVASAEAGSQRGVR
jgi:NADH-quinone oxidoreductase subunit H